MTATAEFVVPRSIPMMGPFTLPLSALVSSAYPLRNCDVKGARYADDLKVDVARGTAYFDVSPDARVMAIEELRLTFRMSLEESMMAVLTHYDTRKGEEEDEAMEESCVRRWKLQRKMEDGIANEESMKFYGGPCTSSLRACLT